MSSKLRKILRPLLLSLVALVGIGAVITWWYHYNQMPAVGMVRTSVTTSEPKGQTVTSSHFKGSTIAFDYTATYTSVENKSGGLTPPITEQYILNKPDATGSSRISIIVKSLSGGPMLEDSAYKFRTLKSTEYRVTDETVAGRSVKKSIRTDGTEIAYFFPGETSYAIITATSPKSDSTLPDEVATVIRSFAWVK